MIGSQRTLSVVIDRFGLRGVQQRSLSPERITGVLLLAAGVYLIVRR